MVVAKGWRELTCRRGRRGDVVYDYRVFVLVGRERELQLARNIVSSESRGNGSRNALGRRLGRILAGLHPFYRLASVFLVPQQLFDNRDRLRSSL